MLSVEKIKKSLGGDDVLRGIDLEIQPNQITALIGPSGSGKTTLMRAMSLIDPPDSGTVVIDGLDYNFPLEPSQTIIRPWPRITVVFQQFFLWPHLTLRQNIVLPTKYRRDCHGHRIPWLLERFKMESFVDRYPNQVSLGQRQRTALIRALALDPTYLLLDEVTSALDVDQIDIVLDLLRELRDRRVGILLVTHNLTFAARLADQVVILNQGKIIASGGAHLIADASDAKMVDLFSVI